MRSAVERKFFVLSSVVLLGVGLMTVSGTMRAWAAAYSDSELRSVENSDETKINDLRRQEITQLRIALGRRLQAHRRADLYLRLAEAYLESYRAIFILEGKVHEKRLEQGQQDRYIDRSHSKPMLRLGIKACEEILRLRIPFPKMDQVYYFLGFYYDELDEKKQSTYYFSELTRRFPGSPYTSEAYRELGNAAYDQRDFQNAQIYFDRAIQRAPDQPQTPRVMHKLAWAYYRTKQFDRAVSTLKQAISRASEGGEKYLSLKEEALRDMAIFMTETGRVNEALSYFQEVAGDRNYYPKVLEQLGRQYERNVEPVKATQVYESLLKTHGDTEGGFRVLVKLVDLDLRRGKRQEALERIQKAKIFTGGEPETETAYQNLRAMVRRTATEHHETFRKTGANSALVTAESFYSLYLRRFLENDDPRKETPEIQMYLADVKRELGKSKEASELYRKVIDSGDKRYAKEAGAFWTASLAEAIRKEAKAGGRKSAKEPSQLEKDFVDAADDLEDALSGTAEAREAALRAAQVLAGYKDSQKDAIKRAKKIISKYPKSSQALVAARLWLQTMSDRVTPDDKRGGLNESAADDLKDTIQELRENSELMATDRDLGGGKLKTAMSDQENRLKIGVIAYREKNQDFGEAAKGYESFANDSQNQELAEKAFANAISSYLKAEDSESVIRVAGTWMARYPKSRSIVDSLRSAATSLLIQGQFASAGDLFEKLGQKGGDADSLETAALVFEGNGTAARAQKDWALYLDTYKQNPRRWKIALSLGQSFEASSDEPQAIRTYRYCMAGPPEFEAECGTRAADLYLKLQNRDEAMKLFRQVAAQGNKKQKILSPFVAYARYKIGELMEGDAKFKNPLQLPEGQLQNAVAERLSFLENLGKTYQLAVDAGGPWGVAALDRLARWAWNFAEEVDHVPPPASAATDPAVAARFRKSLKTLSDPTRASAVVAWKKAYQQATDHEILSPALVGIVDRLAEVREIAVRAQGSRGRFRLAGMASDGGSDGRAEAMRKVRDKLDRNPKDSTAWTDYGNLLWGEGKPLLARIAYERSLALAARNPAALNNRAVVLLSGDGEEDWLRVIEASQLLKDALAYDEFFTAAKINRATLLNYYRIFSKAKPLWDQILVKSSLPEAFDGQATALQGLGQRKLAEAVFEKAQEAGASKSRFARVFHMAAAASLAGADGAKQCESGLSDLDPDLRGFEKEAADNLKRTCAAWKTPK